MTLQELAVQSLIFMTYSFGGWLAEVAITIFQQRKFVNRGFLIGPFCPIYGTGAILLSIVLKSSDSIVAIFCVSIVGAAVLEYTTSFLMEKFFHVRWWDYSEKPMNLNGRICLSALLSFGVVGVLAIKTLTPLFMKIFKALPIAVLYIVAASLFALLIADIVLSLWLILGVRVTMGTMKKDATSEISERIHKIFINKEKLSCRLTKAFPNQTPSPRSPKPKK